MTRRWQRLMTLERACRYIAGMLLLGTGAFYVFQPPLTTTAFFDSAWPPVIWGVFMLLGGTIIGLGLKTKLLQVEQYGVFMTGIGALLLSSGQTMVMFTDPITWTRGGGTLILWTFTAFTAARYFALSADIRAAKLAKKITEGP